MTRIHIIGSGGAGKTVLASRLASALQVPHIELDSLFWGENWQPSETEVFQQVVGEALAGEDWVTDGNYSKVRQIIWRRVQVVVWLDYPLLLVMGRLLWRSLYRIFSRQLLWGRNRESFSGLFFSPDSLLLYVLRTHRPRREQYLQLCQAPEYRWIAFVRLRWPHQAEAWLRAFTCAPGSPAG